jgi:hypothetical protein
MLLLIIFAFIISVLVIMLMIVEAIRDLQNQIKRLLPPDDTRSSEERIHDAIMNRKT